MVGESELDGVALLHVHHGPRNIAAECPRGDDGIVRNADRDFLSGELKPGGSLACNRRERGIELVKGYVLALRGRSCRLMNVGMATGVELAVGIAHGRSRPGLRRDGSVRAGGLSGFVLRLVRAAGAQGERRERAQH